MFPELKKPKLVLVENSVIATEDEIEYQPASLKHRKLKLLDEIHKKQREIYSLLEELKSIGGK